MLIIFACNKSIYKCSRGRICSLAWLGTAERSVKSVSVCVCLSRALAHFQKVIRLLISDYLSKKLFCNFTDSMILEYKRSQPHLLLKMTTSLFKAQFIGSNIKNVFKNYVQKISLHFTFNEKT